jgi:hypothetical protein
MILTMLNNQRTSPAKSDISTSLRLRNHIFDKTDLKTLHHFQNVTVRTLGTELIARVYERELLRLASLVPYPLIHPPQNLTHNSTPTYCMP